MFLSGIHAKKTPSPTEKVVLQKAGLGFKKIKFDLEGISIQLVDVIKFW